MSPFEYIIVLISIILGLGITTILTGLAEVIKYNRSFKAYTPYIIWIVLVFVLHIHEWWVSYELKSIEVWKLPMFLFIILYPINLYILAHLLFPSGISEGFDSKEFYFKHFPKLFVSALILVGLSVIHNFALTDYVTDDPVIQVFVDYQIVQILIMVALLIILISRTRNTKIHLTAAMFLLLLTIVSLIVTQDSLLIAQ
jgi:hypothetical protein